MKKDNIYIIIGFLVLFTFIIIWGIVNTRKKLDKFREDGIETTATVRKVYKVKENPSGRVNNHRLSVSYITKSQDALEVEEPNEDDGLKFEFTLPQMGEYTSAELTLSWLDYRNQKYKVGDKVQILYLPDDHTKAILKDYVE